MSVRIRTAAPATLTAAALVALASPGARATVSGAYNGPNSFTFTVTHMPDFDQVRSSATGIIGLPNSGLNHCVPTSALNLCAYISKHGYPFLSPGVANWQGQTNYNAASLNLVILGTYMMTDPFNGTGGTNGYNGLIQYVANPYIFDVDRYYASGFWAPTTTTIGQVFLNGGLANFCYGRYSYSGNTLTTRHSGHCVTAQKISKSGGDASLKFRDPAGSNDSSTAQSQWMSSSLPAVDKVFFRDGYVRVYSELEFGVNDGIKRIIDSVYAIYPIAGLTDSPAGIKITFPKPFFSYNAPPEPIAFNQASLADLVQTPDNTSILALTKAIAGPGKLHMIDPLSEESEILPYSFTNPKAMRFNRHQELYIIDGRQLICIDVKQDPPASIPIVLPEDGFVGICTDPGDDCVLVIKPGPGAEILKYPRGLGGTPMVISLPNTIPLSGKVWFDCCPEDQSFWLCSEADDKVYQAVKDPASGRYVLGQVIMQDDINNPRCIQLRQCDQLIFACDGSVKEFRNPMMRGGGFEEVLDGPFKDLVPGGCFHVSRSNTNYDPEVHTTEFDFDTDPSLLLPASETPDCFGDMDQDDDVDLDDLQELLFEFGLEGYWRDGDLDQDNTVDLDDLQIMLFNFGRSC